MHAASCVLQLDPGVPIQYLLLRLPGGVSEAVQVQVARKQIADLVVLTTAEHALDDLMQIICSIVDHCVHFCCQTPAASDVLNFWQQYSWFAAGFVM